MPLLSLGNRIVATAVKGMTAQDALKSQPESACGAILMYCLEHVLGASRTVDAGVWEKGGYVALVPAYHTHEPTRDEPPLHAHATPARCNSFCRATPTSAGVDSYVERVAKRITFAPLAGRSHKRAASLRTLLHLLRNTAFPNLLAATNATFPGVVVSSRRTVTRTSG